MARYRSRGEKFTHIVPYTVLPWSDEDASFTIVMDTTVWYIHSLTADQLTTSPSLSSNTSSNTSSITTVHLDNIVFGVEATLSFLALVTNVTGNTCISIIVAVHHFHWLKRTLYTVIQALAVADLVISFHIINRLLYRVIRYGELIHVVVRGMRAWTVYSAVYHLGLVVVDRFLAIMFPIQYKVRITTKMIRICSLLLWILAAITCIGEIFITIGEELHLNITLTAYIARRTVPPFIVFFFLAFVMGFLHGKITIIARRHHCCNTTDTTAGRDLHTHCATKMMIIVVGIYLLLWTPFALTCLALLIMKDVNPFIDAVQNISLSIGMFNSSMNFLIYYECNMKFRRAFEIMYKM